MVGNMVATSSGVCVLPLYAGKVWVGVAPRKLFQSDRFTSASVVKTLHLWVTQSEEPYLVK